MKMYKIYGSLGWLIYCCWSLDTKSAGNVYRNCYGEKAIFRSFNELNTSYPHVVATSDFRN